MERWYGLCRCYGRGWLAKPYAALASLHYGAEAGVVADDEVLAIHVANSRYTIRESYMLTFYFISQYVFLRRHSISPAHSALWPLYANLRGSVGKI